MTKEEIESEKLKQLKRKLVSNAKAILTNHIGLPLGVHKMTKILTWIEYIRPLEIDVQVFKEFDDNMAWLPIGAERLEWNVISLKVEDQKLNKLADIYREGIIDKCWDIVNNYG
ncbi:MAG: hypothetical protein JNM78_00715 [Cyclobacteriaceae bacterium]|nr:hypothetical protein [Cyclobacteriaceae bacterium]